MCAMGAGGERARELAREREGERAHLGRQHRAGHVAPRVLVGALEGAMGLRAQHALLPNVRGPKTSFGVRKVFWVGRLIRVGCR